MTIGIVSNLNIPISQIYNLFSKKGTKNRQIPQRITTPLKHARDEGSQDRGLNLNTHSKTPLKIVSWHTKEQS